MTSCHTTNMNSQSSPTWTELTQEDSLSSEHSKDSCFWVFVYAITNTQNLLSSTLPNINQSFDVRFRSHLHP